MLQNNEIHVWRACLNDVSSIAFYQKLLSADELERADRFYFANGRNQFISARGILRMLISYYLKIQPTLIQFEYNEYGKPAISKLQNKNSLQFNLSHSRDTVIYAFGLQEPIGIDIEYHDENIAALDIADRFFTSSEAEQLRLLESNKQKQFFYDTWTAKEAFTKGLGKGLSLDFDKFEISILSGEVIQYNCIEIFSWRILPLSFKENYSVTLATPLKNSEVKCYDFSLKMLSKLAPTIKPHHLV